MITFGEIREAGASGVIVFCSNYRCPHFERLAADAWPDDHVRLWDVGQQFVCQLCGKRGADVRPDYRSAQK
jgi:hypothetical protein